MVDTTVDYKDARLAARELGIEEEKMIQLLRSGAVPGLELGDTWLVSSRSLAEFLRGEEERQFKMRRRKVPGRTRVTANRSGGGTRRSLIEYVILKERKAENKHIDVLIEVLRAFAARDPEFLSRFSREGGRTRRYVATNPDDLYPGRPRLVRFSKELQPGWWVGTNYSSRDIESILKKACGVAGLRWGADLVVTTRQQPSNRAKALAFVGVGDDAATDVARRHAEYFAETLANGKH